MTPTRQTPSTGRLDQPDVLIDTTSSERRIRRAMLAGGVLVAVALAIAFAGFELRSEQLLRRQQLAEARAFTEEIVAARRFVSMHGGVYVPETEETLPNPILETIPGLKTRIVDESGSAYVLQNPAMVARSIGEVLADGSGAATSFRLVSDRPLNGENRAAGFEAVAFARFRSGAEEHYRLMRDDEGSYLHYVRSLSVEPRCLGCHSDAVGELRGAVSLRLDASALDAEIIRNRAFVGSVYIGAIAVLLLLLYLISRHLVDSLLDAERRLRDIASLDSLTGIDNRRMGMRLLEDEIRRADRTGESLAVVMVDLDHFKSVNDDFGHAFGDQVLQATADAMTSEMRTYDTVARIGGEEFLVLLPGVGVETAIAAAERIRYAIVRHTAEVLEARREGVTASAGVAVYLPGSAESIDALLSRADRALYSAKAAGRDRARSA